MLKFLNAEVTFAEVPDEISLCINITGCPIKCPDCHSKFLWEDKGTKLDGGTLVDLIKKNKDVTCICLMGGDSDLEYLVAIARFIKSNYQDKYKVAWYSGADKLPEKFEVWAFDFIKLGSYNKELGGLNSKTTNQRMYEIYFTSDYSTMNDITYKFWKDESK